MECTWKAVVIIPNVNEDLRGIRFVRVLWKKFTGVINQQIRAAVQFNDVLHGLQTGLGMGTFSLEAKFLQQLTETREEVLYEVSLELRKAYDALERERCLEIMVGYGFGLWMEIIL